MKRVRIAIVSAYPPSRRPLSEYVWHVVQSLRRNPRVAHTSVLADRWAEVGPSGDDTLTVDRCWTFDGVDQPWSVLRAARRAKADAVWFHLHMTSGGNSRRSWLAALVAPLVVRSAGIPTMVNLHNMLGLSDVKWVLPRTRRIDLLGAKVATKLLGAANRVCVAVPEYADLLRSEYGLRRVSVVPLGTFGPVPPVSAAQPLNWRLLAFGHFGTYKRLENAIEAVSELAQSGVDVTLTIAGGDSRHSPGYLAEMARRYNTAYGVSFTGYAEEGEVSGLFARMTACILPYATVTGMSGVAIQAAMYGVSIVASDVPGLRLLEKSGLRMTFYEWDNKESLKAAICHLHSSPVKRLEDVRHNLEWARRQDIDLVVGRYLDLIESELTGPAGT